MTRNKSKKESVDTNNNSNGLSNESLEEFNYTSNILDDNVKSLVENTIRKSDTTDVINYIENLSNTVKRLLIKSAASKVAILDGVEQANNYLRYDLETDIEIDAKQLISEIDFISNLELFILSVKSSPISKKLQDRIIKNKIDSLTKTQENSKVDNSSVINALQKHLTDIYRSVGELPDRNINNIKMARNIIKKEITPFGRKKS